jgi:hypothetical protein
MMNTLAAFVISVLVIWLVVLPMAKAAEERRAEKGRRLMNRVMGEWQGRHKEPEINLSEEEWKRYADELYPKKEKS